MIKILLLDADGVLIDDKEIFLHKFHEIYNVDKTKLLDFFIGEFKETIIDNKDLKEILPKYLDKWNVNDSVDNFILNWFKTENNPNFELIEFLKKFKTEFKIPIFIATNQEKYRTNYLWNDMNFREFSNEILASYKFRVRKPNIDFYQKIYVQLKKDYKNLKPEEILFFDDSLKNVIGAKEFGFSSYQYKNFKDFFKIMKKYNLVF